MSDDVAPIEIELMFRWPMPDKCEAFYRFTIKDKVFDITMPVPFDRARQYADVLVRGIMRYPIGKDAA